MLLHWIWLAHRPGVSDWMKVGLMRHFQDPEDVYYADGEAYDYVEGLSKEAREGLRDKNLSRAEKILAQCGEEKLHLLTIRDGAYPARLKNIADPPILLYYKGRLPDLDGCPTIGVVGTRRASAYGMTAAKRMGYQIGKCGGIVVSGMAFGIDGLAMAGALSAGQPVVGVLGCGADIVYPASNRALFQDVEGHGCILSEFPPGTPPMKHNFPKRNRIISGLSCGVLVVEAPEKSGALITAHQAAEQGREVFVVPGNIDVPSFVGSNRLLREGAIAVSSGWDILSEYAGQFPDKIHKDETPSSQTAYADEVLRPSGEGEEPLAKVAQKPDFPKGMPGVNKELNKKSIDKEPHAAYIDFHKQINQAAKKPKLSRDEERIVEALAQGQRLVDDVIAETGMTTGKMLSVLTMLELKGVIKRLPGKRISLT